MAGSSLAARPASGARSRPALLGAIASLAAVSLAAACSRGSSTTTTTDTTATASSTMASSTATGPGVGSTNAPGTPTTSVAPGFDEPENLVYDSAADVFLVSNIAGAPTARDANGFISRLDSAGNPVALKWIDGSRAGSRLDAPKGIILHGDTIFVADVGAVRLFDRRTGHALGTWTVPGQMENDLSFSPGGTLYITDTGPDKGSKSATDQDAIYRLSASGHATALRATGNLQGPDGIVAGDSGVTYATFKGSSVVRLAPDGKLTTVATLPGNQIDGLRLLPDGSFVVTSWGAKSVYRLTSDGTLHPVATGITSPAGVAYDTRRHRLAITSMEGNRLYFVPLPLR